ncbi:MAG: hypothetical protein HKO53_07845, partial [Gemmatimonadetes bacterium]|nr:hypothetical protein [Gemmatimonadota bacterium]
MRALAYPTVLAALLIGSGCDDLLFDPPEDKSTAAIYVELWETFDRGYAPFEVRAVDWAAALDRHRPADGASEDALFQASSDLLAELDDGHVVLVAPGRPLFVAKQTFRDNTFGLDIDLGIIIRQFTEGLFTSGAARYGALPGDVAYV